MKALDPKILESRQVYKILTAAVAPRPIALVSTCNQDGLVNVAPFSFFNTFGFNPPIVAFSPTNRGRDGSKKDTYSNLMKNKECVVHIVTKDIEYQMNIASAEYGADISEVGKAGFNLMDSNKVTVPRLAESQIHMECKLIDMIDLGGQKGSGNLALCEVLMFHVDERLLNTDDEVNVAEINHIGRNGASYYTNVNSDSLYELQVEKSAKGIGFDQLPNFIKKSDVLTGNQLGRLASVNERPKIEMDKKKLLLLSSQNKLSIEMNFKKNTFNNISCVLLDNKSTKIGHALIAACIDNNNINLAWSIINEMDN